MYITKQIVLCLYSRIKFHNISHVSIGLTFDVLWRLFINLLILIVASIQFSLLAVITRLVVECRHQKSGLIIVAKQTATGIRRSADGLYFCWRNLIRKKNSFLGKWRKLYCCDVYCYCAFQFLIEWGYSWQPTGKFLPWTFLRQLLWMLPATNTCPATEQCLL